MLMHFVYMFNNFSQQFTWYFKQINNVQKVTDYDCGIHHDMHRDSDVGDKHIYISQHQLFRTGYV